MTKALVLSLVLVLSLAAVPAGAQSTMQAETQNGVSYISGGVGLDDVEMLREVRGDYNLHLLFAAQGSGEFLADVKVKILDAKGTTLVDAVSEGPYFYAKAAPGRYRVVAVSEGVELSKTIDVPAKGAVSEGFYWKSAQ